MTTPPPTRDSLARRLVRTSLLIGVIDGLWAVVLQFAFGRSQVRLWQGLAAVPFGKKMFDGGVPTLLLGLAIHFTVAFTWSAIFLLLFTNAAWLRRVLETPAGVFVTSAVYGPLIWVIMSLGVMRVFGTVVPVNERWAIQLAGHIVFVGLPIVWSTTRQAGIRM